MKIAINALSAKMGGGVTYLRNLIPHLAWLNGGNEYIIFASYDNYVKLGLASNAYKNVRSMMFKTPNLLLRMLVEYFILPYVLWKEKIDLYYSPANIAPPMVPCEQILLIQNIDPFVKQKIRPLFQRIRISILKYLSLLAIRRAKKVIILSDYSRRLIANEKGIDTNKMVRIYLGGSLDKGAGGHNIPENKYILAVSNISPPKNYEILFRAYAKLNGNIKDRFQLVIAGAATNSNRNYLLALKELSGKLGLDSRIKYLGEVKGDKMYSLYKGASLFVLPSLIENFPFTPIEAMLAGVPVIASNSTGIPESVGNAGILFDPNDDDELAKKIEMILNDTKIAGELVQKGYRHVEQFKWEEIAKQTLNVFNEAMSNSKTQI